MFLGNRSPTCACSQRAHADDGKTLLKHGQSYRKNIDHLPG
jgi:hypothetical protein